MELKFIRTILVGLVLFVGFQSTANAGIIVSNGNNFNDLGASTIDMQTNLEWFDLTTTLQSRSYCEIYLDVTDGTSHQSALCDGATLYDDFSTEWRIATLDEVTALFNNWFTITTPQPLDTTNVSSVGITPTQSTAYLNTFSAGHSGAYRPHYDNLHNTPWGNANPNQTLSASIVSGGAQTQLVNGSVSSIGYGAFVVRNASANSVPEPSTLAIFLLGMISLISRRFKR